MKQVDWKYHARYETPILWYEKTLIFLKLYDDTDSLPITSVDYIKQRNTHTFWLFILITRLHRDHGIL